MRTSAIVFTCLVVSAKLYAAQPNIDAYAAISRVERTADLAKSYAEYKQLDRSHTKDSDSRRSELKRRIEYLEDPRNPYFAIGTFAWNSLKIGSIGRINRRLIDVLQVRDHHSAITEFPYYTETDIRDSHALDGKFFSERGSATGSEGGKGTTILIKNIDTSEWVDRESRLISGVFAVSGTERYATALGTNTIFVLEQIDIDKDADKFTRKADSRKWKSADGHETDAIFVRYEHGAVTLYKPDGKLVDVPFTKLSSNDKEFVKEKLKELAPPKPDRKRQP